jgi:hypothetical protein
MDLGVRLRAHELFRSFRSETLALTSVMTVVDRLATIPRDHFLRLTVHGLANYVSRFRRNEERTFRPYLRMTTTIAFRRPSSDDDPRSSFDRIAFG